MKLRNKKTGEMCELKVTVNGDLAITKDDEITNICSSLAELNEEWEDYEESTFWFIDEEGIIRDTTDENWPEESVVAAKSLGNYFETKEEAERAVENLKAWKRLKDKGFRFTGHFLGTEGLNIHYECDMKNDISDDLDLLFSGGEE